MRRRSLLRLLTNPYLCAVDHGILLPVPHGFVRRPSRIQVEIRYSRRIRWICARKQLAVGFASRWTFGSAYRGVHRWTHHQPNRISIRYHPRTHAFERHDLCHVLCQLFARVLRLAIAGRYSLGYLCESQLLFESSLESAFFDTNVASRQIANAPAYCSEIVPMRLRAPATQVLQLFWAVGAIIVGGVTYVYQKRDGSQAWK